MFHFVHRVEPNDTLVTFPRDGLSPEQTRAITKLEFALPLVDLFVIPRLPTVENLCVTDKILFIPDNLSTTDIPRAKHWLWNQSRARQQRSSESGDVSLSFYKLNTRAAKHSRGPSPPYKMWVFNLLRRGDNKVISFVWCEKGIKDSEIKENIDFQMKLNMDFSMDLNMGIEMEMDIDFIDVKELAFLKPFIEEHYAEELGW